MKSFIRFCVLTYVFLNKLRINMTITSKDDLFHNNVHNDYFNMNQIIGFKGFREGIVIMSVPIWIDQVK